MTLGQSYSIDNKRIWIAGHRGMVGSALMRRLQNENCSLLTTGDTRIDLRRQADVEAWLNREKPDAVIVAAARVGGIMANDTRPGEFLYDNLAIAGNIIEAARSIGVEKLLYLGSSCIYPRLADQPMREDALLTGQLEPTNQWYAVAKIAGLKMCQAYRRQYGCDFISAMPTNLYGPGDNFDLTSSHVLPALLRKAHDAKTSGAPQLNVWGTGNALREFMHVDDLADALVFILQNYSDEPHINAGTGMETSIRELATTICEVVGFNGALEFDSTKPDGAPRKLMDGTKLSNMGWRATTTLRDGLTTLYRDMLAQGGFDEKR